MKRIKSTNTKPELYFRKLLRKVGIEHNVNVKRLPGKPDITIPSSKIAVFIDGEFWHGYRWGIKKNKIKANRDYWIPKIEGNMTRDKRNRKLLRHEGWIVIRLWEKQIMRSPLRSLQKVLSKMGANEKHA